MTWLATSCACFAYCMLPGNGRRRSDNATSTSGNEKGDLIALATPEAALAPALLPPPSQRDLRRLDARHAA